MRFWMANVECHSKGYRLATVSTLETVFSNGELHAAEQSAKNSQTKSIMQRAVCTPPATPGCDATISIQSNIQISMKKNCPPAPCGKRAASRPTASTRLHPVACSGSRTRSADRRVALTDRANVLHSFSHSAGHQACCFDNHRRFQFACLKFRTFLS